MEQRFEYRFNHILIPLTLMNVILGFAMLKQYGFSSWMPYVWWIGGLVWFYRYLSYRKHGFLVLKEDEVQLITSIWKGIQIIKTSDIETIHANSRRFKLYTTSQKKFIIHKGNIDSDQLHKVEEWMNEKKILN